MSTYDVTALGELLIDFTMLSSTADGYPTMEAHPGGAPANFLAAIAKFGGQTALIGKVGTDTFGKLLADTLRRSGIDTAGLVTSEDVFTTLAFVTLDAQGNREFSFARKPGADMQLSFDEVKLPLLNNTRVFHFGTLSLTDEPSRTATYRTAEYARSHGALLSFDPNFRAPLWKNAEDAKAQMLWGLSHADVVKISDEETDFLFSLAPEAAAEHILRSFPVRLVYVTCGADGCFYRSKTAAGHVDALRDIHVIDTTGAGDIFGGSAMWKLLHIGKVPEELSDSELREIVTFACTAAGLSATKPGGIQSVPSLAEIECYLEKQSTVI